MTVHETPPCDYCTKRRITYTLGGDPSVNQPTGEPKMKTLINPMALSALALSGALLATPLTTVLAEEAPAAQAQETAKGEMGGMQRMQSKGGMMSPEMMAQKQEMMQQKQEMMNKHMTTMEDHMANIEALLRELVELTKNKQ